MQGKSGDIIRLQHIYDAIIEIESYVEGKNFSDFSGNSMMRFACIKQMEIMGEAGNHISEETKAKLPDIKWQQIISMRNIFVHEYFGIDINIVWEIINNDIPDFKKTVISLLDEPKT
ncbi:MAG: DUF86 domain-containing protein [Ignavibacteriales bacterium]|nr:DUF86 domain-containing protein [Ignavibacteriales bacterium]MCF8317075.1 DUF86 domain-containing protein [Ignavibacteriales bacterium]MCF8438656.1 DUF86 domain-containing protein [Ignavibacteriales bacterium]